MRTLRILLLLTSALALGCRVNPNQVLLEQESRLLEDKVWELQGCLEDAHAARESAAREIEALKKQVADKGGDTGPTIDFKEKPSRRSPATPKLVPPTIELPEESEPTGPQVGPADGDSAVVDGQPTQLVFNKGLTGGLDRDGAAGDEGILLAVEPRDAQGQVVRGPGTVSVVVLDPALEGDASRVARWDFQPEDVARHFTNTSVARGLQFELNWPGEVPKNRDLRVFVRYTTPEGRKITADMPIEIRGPADAPMLSSRPKGWSTGDPAKRPPRERKPASRLKSPRSAARDAREAPASDAAEGAPPRWDGQRDQAPPVESREPIQQAQRPEWKPYR